MRSTTHKPRATHHVMQMRGHIGKGEARVAVHVDLRSVAVFPQADGACVIYCVAHHLMRLAVCADEPCDGTHGHEISAALTGACARALATTVPNTVPLLAGQASKQLRRDGRLSLPLEASRDIAAMHSRACPATQEAHQCGPPSCRHAAQCAGR